MKVLSLFDGMACGYLAMQKSGLSVSRYEAFEVDKYAIKTSTHNFPDIKHRGDVFEGRFEEFKGFDFLLGGSPCTYWSIAQKNNRETEASGMGWELFSQYVRALKEAQPKYFIYENNKSMSNAIRESITKTFGFEPICINSALVSAQNRQRLYWVGKRNEDGTYSKVEIEQPIDKGILLKDILEDGIVDKEKAYCLKHQAGNARDYFKKHHTQIKFEPVRAGAMPKPNGELSTSQSGRVYSIEGKAVNLTSGGGGAGAKTGLYAIPLNVTEEGKSQTIKAQYQQTSPANILGYSSTYGATGVAEAVGYAEPIEWEDGKPTKAISKGDGKTYKVYEVKGGLITINGKEYSIKLSDGYYIIRKLTVRECMRLQTVPEWYEFPVSDTQAYKMLGNGWTIDVISYLITEALADKPIKGQISIYDLI